ncbi:MAG: PQQ-dependent sugar dehydrogenase [Okeania sp. SIO3I5]|nr:PQQ-dependent sugar dehydrogenase [Okeania sp. SIO3I5]NEQ40766.1 PQQ-dependent sugar dehydrogenase [Okeania sp. SIO3I5]
MKPNITRLITGTLSATILYALVGCSSTNNSSSAQSTFQSSTPENTNISRSNNPLLSDSNVAVAKNFKTTTLLEGLERPWSMAWLPDGAMLITERPGRLRIVRNGTLDLNPIAGVPEVFAVSQGGLMDVSLHPNFQQNRWVYFTYSHGTNQANRTRVARATFDGSSLKNWEVIFQVSQTKARGQHFGSRIVWLPDNTMLVAIGDGGNPPNQLDGDLIRKQAQNLNSHLGKVVRLNDDGSIPQDNPFAASDNTDPAIWSYGHRNIQGITLDSATNRLWSTEHGSRGGDELNLVEAGKNYGWPLVTHSKEYTGGEISDKRSLPGMIDPKVVWTPAIAPSGLAFYSGKRFQVWEGDLFAGGLVSRDVRRIDLDANGNVVREESIPIGRRVRDVRQSPDGRLYVLTDEQNGQLISIEPTN